MRLAAVIILILIAFALPVQAQMEISGLVRSPKYDGASETFPFCAVHVFGSLAGSGSETLGFRTWELEPSGWYRLIGPSGRYSMALGCPGRFMRPIVLNNVYTQSNDVVNINLSPSYDYAVFADSAWDTKPAKAYYQVFSAKGTSITDVGFKLIDDGVDGIGPGAQNVLISIHRKGSSNETPDKWKQVGPAMPVLNVDCGGPKNYFYSAGWNSGEVPTVPGETYAVCIQPESKTGKFQTYWRQRDDKGSGCFRIGEDGSKGYTGCDMWLAVSSDSDGLVIPYNKRVHKEFVGETHFAKKWSQTYVAQGRSLASVMLYAATSGIQPGLTRQRIAVRVREGGPKGPVVGIEKIAIGSGNFTGDASWGVWGAVFAPGEVKLVPGKTYAVEFESMENLESLHGYVNIKGMKSDDKPGFHPYPKVAPDTYKQGRAYLNGDQAMDYDLDMEVIEYQADVKDWEKAVDTQNLIKNGDMSAGDPAVSKTDSGRPAFWKEFKIDPATLLTYIADDNDNGNRILRVLGGSATGAKADGGYVQRIDGLSKAESYKLTGRVRSSWVLDTQHACYVGFDSTGQTADPKAATIIWTPMPNIHSVFAPYESIPIRPLKDTISVWVRGKTTLTNDYPFKADFDDLEIHRIQSGIPR